MSPDYARWIDRQLGMVTRKDMAFSGCNVDCVNDMTSSPLHLHGHQATAASDPSKIKVHPDLVFAAANSLGATAERP